MSLAPCPSCARHVRRAETACPFCGTALSLAPSASRLPTERLGRAAIFAFGAAMATSVAACSTSTTQGTDAATAPDAGGVDASPEDAASPDGGATTSPDAASPDAGVFPPYGTPPFDSGADDAGLGDQDAGPGLLYGAPPP